MKGIDKVNDKGLFSRMGEFKTGGIVLRDIRNPLVPDTELPHNEQKGQEHYDYSDSESDIYEPKKDWLHAESNQPKDKAVGSETARCVQCCDRPPHRRQRYHYYNEDPPEFEAIPQINLTILK
eukprot:g39091.t1